MQVFLALQHSLGKSWTGSAQTFADGVVLETEHAYDGTGRNISTRYPSGKLLTRTFGMDGQIESLSYNGQPILGGADWTSYGAVKGWQWGLDGLSSGQQNVSLVSHSAVRAFGSIPNSRPGV